jgi:VanZ family protein
MWAMLSPGTTFPEVALFNFQDKLIHWLAFAIQGYLWSGVGQKTKNPKLSSPKIWINFLVFGVGLGVILEFSQQFIPFRTYDYIDMIVNVIGAFSGLLIYFKVPSIKYILE